MPFTVLHGFPLRSAIIGHYRPTNVVVPDVKIDVTFEDPDGSLQKVFSKDPLLLNQLVDLLQPLLRGDLAKLMAGAVHGTELNMADAHKVKREADAKAHSARLPAKLNEVKKQLLPKIEAVAVSLLTAHAAKRKAYTKYKVKAGIGITLSVAGVAASVAGIVLSGGGSSLISLIGIARGASEIIQQCKSLYDDAETVSKQVLKGILKVAQGPSSDPNMNALNEVGRAVVKSLTTIDFVATPAKCADMNQTFGIKLTGLEVGQHNTAIKLSQLLDANEVLMRSVRSNPNPRVVQKLEQAENSVVLLIEKVAALGERVKAGTEEYKFYAEIIRDMQAKVAGWGGKAAALTKVLLNTGIGLATGAAGGVIGGSIAGGLPFASAAESATEGAVGIGKIISESAATLVDLIGIYQELASAFGEETADQTQRAFPRMPPAKSVPRQ
ncbi:hypothetical protein [Gemmatimonas sp.]|uniref:hypothetical protein n=1 Tax=Gemmatimonas sp. TaxID=1962908 RepID=UPI0035695C2F